MGRVVQQSVTVLQEKAALEEQCAQLRLQAQTSLEAPTLGESHTPSAPDPDLAALLAQRTSELHAAERRSQDAAAEVQTLLAAVARHREEVAVIYYIVAFRDQEHNDGQGHF